MIKTVSPSRIINFSETPGLLHLKGLPTYAELGCQPVQAKIHGDEKDSSIVVALMTAPGEKLLHAFIAPGKTMRVEESLIIGVEEIGELTPKASGRAQKRFKPT
jgi:hypothetical protein